MIYPLKTDGARSYAESSEGSGTVGLKRGGEWDCQSGPVRRLSVVEQHDQQHLPLPADYVCPEKPWSCDECAAMETQNLIDRFPGVEITNNEEFRVVANQLWETGLVRAPWDDDPNDDFALPAL